MKSISLFSAAFVAAIAMTAMNLTAADAAPAADTKPATAAAAEAKPAEKEGQAIELSAEQQQALLKMFNTPATAEEIEKALYFLPDVLVELDGKKLTREEILGALKKKSIPSYALENISDDELRSQIKKTAESWVEKQTLLAAAKKAGFEPTAEFAKKKLDEEIKTLTKEEREKLDTALKAEGKTLDDYTAEISKDSSLLENLVINCFIDKTIAEPAKKAITDKEIETFYNENKKSFETPALMTTAHILIMPEETEDADKKDAMDKAAKEKIDAIAKDLKADPSKFGEIAEAKSDCPSGKSSKGELPAFAEDGSMPEGGAMIPEFAAAAFKLEKDGQISEPVKTQYGYHIIKRISKKDASVETLDKVKDEIKDYLASKKISAELETYIEKLTKDVKAKYNDFKAKPAAEAKDAKADAKDAKDAAK